MNQRFYINDGWTFTERFTDEFLEGANEDDCQVVRLPHTVKELPYNYFDADLYQMVCGYRGVLNIPKDCRGKRVFLVIEAAAHKAEVFLNGEKIAEHACGYTAFKTEITEYANIGENLLVIKVDCREELNQPPFGKVIDYMTYGGLYREVYLEVTDLICIEDVFAMPKADLPGVVKEEDIPEMKVSGSISSKVKVSADLPEELYIRQRLFGPLKDGVKPSVAADSKMVSLASSPEYEKGCYMVQLFAGSVSLWDVNSPSLYTLCTELYENVPEEEVDMGSTDLICGQIAGENTEGLEGRLFRLIDKKETVTGFRESVFKADGYYLNGRKLKIIGLNRHQSYPYAGYAMPASMQRLDADILKNELGVNAVRTSHYPCSQHFYDRCDETGLLVFTEIPGWQNIGDGQWKDQALENTKEMVLQYRDHPSVILWGVRINESVDCDELYEKTNAAARELDPTRPTGGVRYLKKSHLLEDVYTYNDFSFDGTSLKEGLEEKAVKGKNTWRGCEQKSAVIGNMDRPYLISEYNGHMFPAKTFDCEDKRTEHALRHAAVLDSVAVEKDIAGSFGWCMFDYNTHKEFGSGDHICHHGVMDMFRNPKPAAAVYAAQQDETPVLEISSSMDIGEHPGGLAGRIWIITNADEVRFYKNDKFIRTYTHEESCFKNMKNGPIEISDYLGDLLEREEGFEKAKADDIKELLNAYARFGANYLAKKKLKTAKTMMKYKLSMDDAYALYGKYIGGWGDENTSYKFEAVKDGKVVKTVVKEPASCVVIKAIPDHTLLKEDTSYDVAAVRITAQDQNKNPEYFYFGPVILETEGPIEVIGPDIVQLKGGFGGTYVKTTGESGKAALILKNDQAGEEKIEFTVKV